MPRKRTGYDAACYYDGKLLGRCTKADSDAYTLLMNACGGDAARVLREYAYFSSELRAILEKAALMQADRSRTGGMFHAPKSSPWGEVQSCETLCPGVFLVSTASHGGTMVANEVAAVLSPAAKKCGFKDKGYICYEEDAQESVVLRELLDKKCIVVSTVTEKLTEALATLKKPPGLIITDSQAFAAVWEKKPKESALTSVSVLFAAYKGDMDYYREGALRIGALTARSRVLVAECCTHAPLEEDIGREKIPRMLRRKYGENMQVDIVSGTDFPEDLTGYDLIIQCGGCMASRKYILARVRQAKKQGVPMTNYGVAIAYLTGIWDKIFIL